MSPNNKLSAGDEWMDPYRGYRLQVSPNGDVWWQLYNGTDRLKLDPVPEGIVETVLEFKQIGGRIRITENNDVLTKIERDNDEYEEIWIGEIKLEGRLTPDGVEEHMIEVKPSGLRPGDLWPSVYDGSKYSFAGESVWWGNPETHKRHPIETDLSAPVFQELKRHKPRGGSFRVTPWGDVITLIPSHPTPEKVESQFSELPRIVQNIIRLRKERGVEMLPIYVGSISDVPLEVNEPDSLTDPLSDDELKELESWAKNLGQTTQRSRTHHTRSADQSETRNTGDDTDTAETGTTEENEEETIFFDDDPLEWERDFEVYNAEES